MSLKIAAGEVVALLGPNGAGKSSAFKVMAGMLATDNGEVLFNGLSTAGAKGRAERARRLYIAQQHTESTLHGAASTRDHLELYAAIKGLHAIEVNRVAELFDLGDKANEAVHKLSGGMGRKGCAAVALLGAIGDTTGQAVALLDEVTAGVDVSARRAMTVALGEVRGNFAGVLCTHNLEEADALCDRVAVMIKGQIRALGTSQELKRKFGHGYKLDLSCKACMSAEEQAAVDAYVVQDLCVGAELQDAHPPSGRRSYLVPATYGLAYIFRRLEEEKCTLGINEYSLAQPTLEQVFLKLVRAYGDGDDGDIPLV